MFMYILISPIILIVNVYKKLKEITEPLWFRFASLHSQLKLMEKEIMAGNVSRLSTYISFGIVDVNEPFDPHYGWRLLMVAAREGNRRILDMLLENGANNRLMNCNGDTALTLAAHYGNTDCVRALIDVGCDDEDVRNAFAIAQKSQYSNREIENLLIY